MKPEFKIVIPEPCHEKWYQMTENHVGKFCDLCQKSVVDFTGLTDQELKKWFKKNQGKSCGRFKPEQLNRLMDSNISNRKFSPGLIAASLIAFLSFPKLSEARQVEKHNVYQLDKNQNVSSENQNSQTSVDSLKTIKGKVVDKDDKAALPGVSILLNETNYRTSTNEKGEFLVKIPKDFSQDKCSITINYIGYKRLTSIINLLKPEPLNLELCISTEVLGGAEIVYVRNPSIWDRLRQLFGKKN
ncbi:carboxypeptidase-like regulatory domain-containing protein [Pedobacter nototheniae]|uniref:carboxypeptidase-like regulatory domain-containing protein n=1 Tax=Pedobacter nototheniae TaxID=2488994 RepID=UPI001040804C|nr:carboxypeptidase-like regulatory domain-containing protein [Pedobacter nototheniae]